MRRYLLLVIVMLVSVMVNGHRSSAPYQRALVQENPRTVNGQRSKVNGQWSMVNGQWSMVTGQWSTVNDKKPGSAHIRWGTFNIRLQNDGDERAGVGWSVRRDRVADYIRKNHIDVVGMQEVLHAQLEDLLARLPEYDYVGVGRTDGATKGEYSPVFFLKEKFEVLEKGNFWLSETPEVPGSVGWDAALERIASYAKLRDKATGKVFMAVNTHFDHVGVKARRESAKLIMRKIQEIVGTRPAVVTGDFNVTENDEAYKTMTTNTFKMNDAYHMTPNHTGTCYTWHQFCQIPPLKCEKIDFIFITPTIRVNHSHIEVPNPAAMLSDHNPHWADLEF